MFRVFFWIWRSKWHLGFRYFTLFSCTGCFSQRIMTLLGFTVLSVAIKFSWLVFEITVFFISWESSVFALCSSQVCFLSDTKEASYEIKLCVNYHFPMWQQSTGRMSLLLLIKSSSVILVLYSLVALGMRLNVIKHGLVKARMGLLMENHLLRVLSLLRTQMQILLEVIFFLVIPLKQWLWQVSVWGRPSFRKEIVCRLDVLLR